MIQLTKNLACEWAKDNVRVNCIAPWIMRTSFVDNWPSVNENLKKVESRTPMRRIGELEEVSPMVAFLCLVVQRFGRVSVDSVESSPERRRPLRVRTGMYWRHQNRRRLVVTRAIHGD
ncbi:hypothetical protein ACH5RR_008698 [Cinchona calisaya]|uniref:Uncharacterized protein n=1 Tax=Cinchona calisaya TaxID=153742 RepID=A0ABD3AEK6_9GENT